jgi:putative ABC transport system permease protein
MWISASLERLGEDARFAVRRLRRSPGFTAIALTCITLGVGVTTTIFGAVNGILLRPLPFVRDGELVALHARNLAQDVHASRISWADYASWREQNHTLSAIGIWSVGFQQLTGPEGPVERVDGATVSVNLLSLLGLRPALGRTFVESDEQSGHEPVVLLGYALWQGRFGGDRAIVGKSIQLSNRPCVVVGVMPSGIGFPEGTEIWTPLSVVPAQETHGARRFAGAIGRLRPGATLDQAQTDFAAISRRLQKDFPSDDGGWDAEVTGLRDDLVGVLRRPILILLGAALVVLLIASANVGNLMLARGALRRRETAIAVAMGASRGRIVRQVLTECVLLALIGGAAGTVLAHFGLQLITLAFPDGVPSYLRFAIDGAVVAFTVLVSLSTAALFGIVPALRATNLTLAAALHEAGRGADAAGGRRLRGGLVSAEVALSLVLLVAATLFVRSDGVLEREMGIDPHGVLSFRVPLPMQRYAGPQRRAFYERLFERVRGIGGVQAVGSTQGLPFGPTGGSHDEVSVSIEGRPVAHPGQDRPSLRLEVSTDYFKVMRVPIIAGRPFVPEDYDRGVRVGIVNELFARRHFAGENPLGKRIRFADDPDTAPWMTVVGIAGNVRQDRPPQPIEPGVYVPLDQGGQTLVVRTALANPLAIAADVRAIVRKMDPTLPTYLVQSLDHLVNGALWRQRLQARVLAIFAALALVLAIVGMYGVISYTVAERTRELGIRMALGASSGQVLRLVLAQGARLAAVGVVAGIAVALSLSRVLSSLLYGVQATDPATLLGVGLGLASVAVFASLGPARRASKVDPQVAMRTE